MKTEKTGVYKVTNNNNEAIKNMAQKVIKLHDGRVLMDYVNDTVKPAKELEW